MGNAEKCLSVEVPLDHLLNHRVRVHVHARRRLVQYQYFAFVLDQRPTLDMFSVGFSLLLHKNNSPVPATAVHLR